MQSRGLKLNPITTLYYIAPASFGFLAILWLYMEAEAVLHHPIVSCCTTPRPIDSLSGEGNQTHQRLAMHTMVCCKQRSPIAELRAHHSFQEHFLCEGHLAMSKWVMRRALVPSHATLIASAEIEGLLPLQGSLPLAAPILISNAAIAFGLNLSVFLLIGKTSALAMNIAGVVKDWLLIGLSTLLFNAQVFSSLAFTGADKIGCEFSVSEALLQMTVMGISLVISM